MKQLFLVAFITLTFQSFGQLTKNNWLVGGAGSFFSKNGTYTTQSISYNSKYTDLTISPNIGYFIIDKFSAGLKPSFSWTKSKTFPPGGGSTDIKRFLVGPFARYYFISIEKQFNILAEGTVQFGTYSAGADKGAISNYSFMAGPVIFFNTSVGLEFLLGYSSSIEDINDRYKNSISGFQIGIGFQIHLEK